MNLQYMQPALPDSGCRFANLARSQNSTSTWKPRAIAPRNPATSFDSMPKSASYFSDVIADNGTRSSAPTCSATIACIACSKALSSIFLPEFTATSDKIFIGSMLPPLLPSDWFSADSSAEVAYVPAMTAARGSPKPAAGRSQLRIRML